MPSAAYQAILQALFAQERVAGRPVADQRADYDALGEQLPPPQDAVVEGADGAPVPSTWVRMPGAAEDAAVLWLHGGGYTIGSPRTYLRLGADLGRGCGLPVLLPDYRLAPEHPHPAAVHDGVAAYRWLLAQGIRPERIALGGDSAGGGLAVATLVALREAGVRLPAAAAVLSPWVDLTLTSSTWQSRKHLDPLVGGHNAPEMAEAYLGGQDPTTPLASPLHADLRGLPPLLVLVGDHEVLLDDARGLERRAREHGVDATLREFPELHHIWPIFTPDTPEGVEAVELLTSFWRRHLAR